MPPPPYMDDEYWRNYKMYRTPPGGNIMGPPMGPAPQGRRIQVGVQGESEPGSNPYFRQGGSGYVMPWQGPPIGGGQTPFSRGAHYGAPVNPLMAPTSGGYNYQVPGSQNMNYQPPNAGFGNSRQVGQPNSNYGPQMGGYGYTTGNPYGYGLSGSRGDAYSPLPPWVPQPPTPGTVDDRTRSALDLYDREANEGMRGLQQQMMDMGLGRSTSAAQALARRAGYTDIGRRGLIGQLGESDRAYGLQLGGMGLQANRLLSDQDYRDRLLRQNQVQNAPPPWSTLYGMMSGYGQGQGYGQYIPGFGWTG